jgi:hypothetical protein
MAFLIFEKEIKNGKLFCKNINEPFKLAGWGLIYNLWRVKGKPVNKGYSLTADELLKQHNDKYSCDTHSLIIDFHPSSLERIGLVEIKHIHLYTFGQDGNANWTPMMLELQDVYYNEDIENLTYEEKTRIIGCLEIQSDGQKIIEFLYLNGDDKSWNWGKNGMTNASFLHEGPRKYFRNFF